jgi:transposase
MGTERRVFTAEFKRNAVELAQGSDRPKAEIARELGIRPGALYRWIDEAKDEIGGSRKAFVGQGTPRDEELSRLRKENADLRETNEILKKATAIFVQGRLR